MGEEASIRTLIAFLREELATVVGYRRALSRFSDVADADELRACLASHERRIATLEQRIRFLGGDPDAESDEAESFDAPALGVGGDAAIAALEESEDRGLKHYLDDVCKLDRDTRSSGGARDPPRAGPHLRLPLRPETDPAAALGWEPWEGSQTLPRRGRPS